ncbi:MAG: hypothetical protein AAFY39_11460 [Pseudomonadota bacterium]
MNISFPRSVSRGPKALLKSALRPGVQMAREMPVHVDHLRQAGGKAPLAVFLPAYGRQGAALLRMYNIAQALRPFGWRTLVLPPSLGLQQRLRLLHGAGADVIVMQGARHALNRPALYPGFPILFDMDDADFHLPHLADPVRRAMPDVAGVIAGSRYVADWCRQNGAGVAHVVWTGTPVSEGPRPAAAARKRVIAWAQSRPMTYVHEAALVAQVSRAVAAQCPNVTLRLYDRQPGDDAGFIERFRTPDLAVEWAETSQYSDYLSSFDDVAVGLAPLSIDTPFSRGKSFGKVLAYLDRAVPVVGSDRGEHGQFFTPETGVITNDPAIMVRETVRLLKSPEDRHTMATAAFSAFRQRLSVEAAAEHTHQVLSSVVAARKHVT